MVDPYNPGISKYVDCIVTDRRTYTPRPYYPGKKNKYHILLESKF